MVNEVIDKEAEFIGLLESEWDTSNTRGYNPNVSLPVADSIENVGAVYPSLIVGFSNETTGGETGYSYMSQNGPGSNNVGTLVCTARAQDDEDNQGIYENGVGSAVRADRICKEIIAEVRRICYANPTGGNTAFETLGADLNADAPDDTDESPPVRLEQCTVNYSIVESPE